MINEQDMWWPKAAQSKHVRHAPHQQIAIDRCSRRRVAIQAGGHCGAWPLYLANHFDYVYTWEPDFENFPCLMRNIVEKGMHEKIYASRAMLGQSCGMLTMAHNGTNTGGHRGKSRPGLTPCISLDAIKIVADLIVLDVEHMELPVLRGAEVMLREHHPVLHLECKDFGRETEWGNRKDLFAFLESLGYRQLTTVGKRDAVFLWK